MCIRDRMCDVAWQYGLNRSTVGTVLTKKDITKKTQAVTKIASEKQNPPSMKKWRD